MGTGNRIEIPMSMVRLNLRNHEFLRRKLDEKPLAVSLKKQEENRKKDCP